MTSRSAGPAGLSVSIPRLFGENARPACPAVETQFRLEGDGAEIREEMQEIAGKRRRFGYRRIGVLLERKGMSMNHSGAGKENSPGDCFPGGALYRIYREEGLSVKV